MSELVVRPCFQQDLDFVRLIYGHHVMTGTASFETVPPDLEETTRRWTHVVTKGWPYLVACPARDLTRVLGFATAQTFRDREAYSWTYEDSVYVAPTSLQKGVGKLLLGHLLQQLREDGAREIIAVIGDSGNEASIRLHAAAGFVHAGTLKNVGFKFDRWLDVVLMQRSLADRP